MADEKKRPAIRFQGFDGDWEQRKLGEVAGRYDNLRIPVTASARIPGSIPYYGANGIQDYVEGFTHDGEFILIAEDGANDLRDYPVHYINGKVWVNNHAHVIQAIKGLSDNKFIKYSFYMINIEPYLVGGSRAKLNANTMMDLTINIPAINEQEKIGSYFSNIDHLITLHQRKHEKLKIFKKAMLEKMFPKNAQKVPELRFSGFDEDWEQRKLGECFDERQERSAEGELISVTTNDGIRRFSELGRHDNSSDDKSHYKKVVVGDIAYNSMRMWQGASGYSLYSGILSPAYTVIIPKTDVDSLFFSYVFKKTQMIRTFQTSSQGITSDTWNLKYPAFSEIEAILPKIEEQKQIAAFFQNLDYLITLHQRKVEKLQIIKKSMLEKMFV